MSLTIWKKTNRSVTRAVLLCAKVGDFMNIRSIHIDFDKNILEINGNSVKKKTVAYLPRDDGWEISKLFKPDNSTEECDRIRVTLISG